MRLVAALLAGPLPRPGKRRRNTLWAATLPLIAILLLACAAGAAGLTQHAFIGAAGRMARCLPLAVASTALCAVAASPAAWGGCGLPWLVPAWVAAGLGAAGWSMMPVPHTPLTRVVETAGLLLPFVVLGLGGALSAVGANLPRAGAAAGTSPLLTARLHARAAWPGAARTMLATLALSVALLASHR